MYVSMKKKKLSTIHDWPAAARIAICTVTHQNSSQGSVSSRAVTVRKEEIIMTLLLNHRRIHIGAPLSVPTEAIPVCT